MFTQDTLIDAARAGNADTISNLLAVPGRVDINAVDTYYGTALAAAAAEGQESIILLLLDRGADINAVGGHSGPALTAAATSGHISTVSLLLDKEADINVVGGNHGTALAAAATEGHISIVSLLLDRGADINTAADPYGTALAAAATRGNTAIVSLLLDRRADINMVGAYGSALAAAAIGGNKPIVSLLLDRGADINIVGGKYGTALAAAAIRGHRAILSLLLDREADINAVGCKYGTALAAAIILGHRPIVQLFLDRGAGVGSDYDNVLTVAAIGGHESVVSLVLDRGADINAADRHFGTALAIAAVRNDKTIVSLLLDRGADINAVGGHNGTALAAAAIGGNTSIVSLLLDRGADVNLVGGHYGTALAAATYRGDKSTAMRSGIPEEPLRKIDDTNALEVITEHLLERNADINVVIGKYGSEFGKAIYEGRREDVQWWLKPKKGVPADVLRIGGSYSNALGRYPNALDAAQAEGSGADEELVALIKDSLQERMSTMGPVLSPTLNLTEFELELISRAPFPMPYTGPWPSSTTDEHNVKIISEKAFREGEAITADEADVPCQSLKMEELTRSLVALVGLDKSTAERLHQCIQNDIRYFVECKFDFGLAYAAARVAWKRGVDEDSICVQRGEWLTKAKQLDEERAKAIGTNDSGEQLIESPYSIMPRRIWDVKSNRVVEFRMLHAAVLTSRYRLFDHPRFWAISHSWTSDMHSVETSVNQKQWRVPVPKGVDLVKDLRSELLSIGAEYVWLDVLCLRQPNPTADSQIIELTQNEWKLDVPTMGNIYRAADRIVRYFNGLGIQFSNEGWDNHRHWLRRAWTLQEITSEHATIDGGIPRDKESRGSILNIKGRVSDKDTTFRRVLRPVLRLAKQLNAPGGCSLYDLAREMAIRHSTTPVDKLAGLFYLLRTTHLPCYDAQTTDKQIWRQWYYLLPMPRQIEILWEFPYRGSDNDDKRHDQWFPTWAQIMLWPERDPDYDHAFVEWPGDHPVPSLSKGETTEETSIFFPDAWLISGAIITEIRDASEYYVTIGNRAFSFYSPYKSQDPIDPKYQQTECTLAAHKLGHDYNWLICEALEKRRGTYTAPERVVEISVLRKIGIIRTDSCSEILVGGSNGESLLVKSDCLFV